MAALVLAAFARPGSWDPLLYDGDTGWHVRTGEIILQTHSVPTADRFSFTRPGQPWFAWEWLTDLLFAVCARWDGLRGVAAASIVVICAAAAILFAWLLRRGAGLWIALAVSLAVVSASTVHYLARPHIFSILFFTVALAVLDRDRRRPDRLVWWLAPLSALWANLHAGFVAWIPTLALLLVTEILAGDWTRFRRHAWLAAGCAAATLANPYGWRLHQHIARYLGSSWILENIQEFQSPRIRSENMLVFAVLLLVGVGLAGRALERRQWFEGSLVLLWAFAALRSARHIPLLALVAAPVIAAECALLWSSWAARSRATSPVRLFWDAGVDLGRWRHASLWGALPALLVLALVRPPAMADFPAARFPVAAVARNRERLAPPAAMPRLLTSDTWGSYVIFKLYPRQRVFFDGRSDFYGPALGTEYFVLLSAAPQWPEVFGRYRFDLALLPLDWPLGSILKMDPNWELVYHDATALLFARRPEASGQG